MKIFTLVILVGLLLLRIKSTPSALSKREYSKKIRKTIENNKLYLSKNPKPKPKPEVVTFVMFLISILFALFYANLGDKYDYTYFIVLSVLQILTVIYSWHDALSVDPYTVNAEDFKFKRMYFLFNTILDYVYYLVAIYLVLKF